MIRLPKRMQVHQSQNRAKVQEKATAKRVGGAVVRGSGSTAHFKGDVQLKGFVRIESKTTQHKSFSVTAEMLDKIEGHSLQAGEFPVMDIEIDNTGARRSVYVVPQWALDMILQRVAEMEPK